MADRRRDLHVGEGRNRCPTAGLGDIDQFGTGGAERGRYPDGPTQQTDINSTEGHTSGPAHVRTRGRHSHGSKRLSGIRSVTQLWPQSILFGQAGLFYYAAAGAARRASVSR
jgi:hypothetical protein